MNSIYMVIVLLFLAVYLFFSYIFVGTDESGNRVLSLVTLEDQIKADNENMQTEFAHLAGLFGFEYSKAELEVNTTTETLGDIPVAVKFILISGDYIKVKIELEVAGQTQIYNLAVGDLVLEYELVEIRERFIRFKKDEQDHVVKVFKPNVLASTVDN